MFNSLTRRNYTRTKAEMEEEYRLIQDAQRNPKRFGVLYQRYYEAIFVFVFKRVSDEDQTADLTSQVFLKAMTHLKNYKFQGVPFSAWLYRIAMNEVNQFFRQSKNQRTISMEKSQLADIVQEVEEGKSEENIWRMVEALQELSPEDVQLIEFRYFERIPFKEIALIYGITENNAKVRVHRLLAKLKKIMTRREICQDTK